MHTKPGIADRFISDVSEVVADIMKEPDAECSGQVSVHDIDQWLQYIHKDHIRSSVQSISLSLVHQFKNRTVSVLSRQGALYGMAQSIPDRSLVSDIAGSFFDAYYSTKDKNKKQLVNGAS